MNGDYWYLTEDDILNLVVTYAPGEEMVCPDSGHQEFNTLGFARKFAREIEGLVLNRYKQVLEMDMPECDPVCKSSFDSGFYPRDQCHPGACEYARRKFKEELDAKSQFQDR
jgi:hypothetical protein